jgi:cytochrome c-type biogenesis protein
MIEVGIIGAFFGGLLSFVSPCVLPLVPPYLCYLAGVSIEELKDGGLSARTSSRILSSAAAFVLGFTTVFVALGSVASAVGQMLAQYLPQLAVLAGIAIILMGLNFLGVFRLLLFNREARVQVREKPAGLFGAYLIGLAFAFGWTPCIGPILTPILALAGVEETVARGAFLLLVYSLGLGVPFLIAAAFSPVFLAWAARFRRHLGTVERTMGGLLIVTGILFITGQMSAMSYWLLETFPALGRIG